MLTPELEQLINYALEDGVLTDKERSVLMRKRKLQEQTWTSLR